MEIVVSVVVINRRCGWHRDGRRSGGRWRSGRGRWLGGRGRGRRRIRCRVGIRRFRLRRPSGVGIGCCRSVVPGTGTRRFSRRRGGRGGGREDYRRTQIGGGRAAESARHGIACQPHGEHDANGHEHITDGRALHASSIPTQDETNMRSVSSRLLLPPRGVPPRPHPCGRASPGPMTARGWQPHATFG